MMLKFFKELRYPRVHTHTEKKPEEINKVSKCIYVKETIFALAQSKIIFICSKSNTPTENITSVIHY